MRTIPQARAQASLDFNEEAKLEIPLGKFEAVIAVFVVIGLLLSNSAVSASKRRFCRMLNKSNSQRECLALPPSLLPRRALPPSRSLHGAVHRRDAARRGGKKFEIQMKMT